MPVSVSALGHVATAFGMVWTAGGGGAGLSSSVSCGMGASRRRSSTSTGHLTPLLARGTTGVAAACDLQGVAAECQGVDSQEADHRP